MAVQAEVKVAPALNLATPPLDERSKHLRYERCTGARLGPTRRTAGRAEGWRGVAQR